MMARNLHPGAWWIWALGLATAASATTNPWLLLLLVLVAAFVVLSRRTDAPWALSFRFYLFLGFIIVVLRVVFRIIFGGAGGSKILFTLPEIPLPEWARGITLLGPVSQETLLAGVYDGLRLAAIIIAIGAANSLANPKRLMKSMPPALYELGTAVVVALAVFPQLAESIQRVRRARKLRGNPPRGIGGLRSLFVPVLEDALERSMSLAAGMDARGYGRTGTATVGERRVTGVLLLAALAGLGIGSYAFLDSTAPRWLAWPMIAAGVMFAVLGFILAGRRVNRTRYRPDQWHAAELVTAASGVVLAVAMHMLQSRQPDVLIPSLTAAPELSLFALAAVMIAIVPAFSTPPPASNAPGVSNVKVEVTA